MPHAREETASIFTVAFADAPAHIAASIRVELPVLRGDATETLFRDARPAGRRGAFALFESDEWLIGCASLVAEGSIEALTRQLYSELFLAAGGRHLCRVWNYVPRINGSGLEGIENYRAFSAGRSHAFEAEFGAGFKNRIPAASAVGAGGGRLAVIFAAAIRPPEHRENPVQVPAYDYPLDYGPRSPSFARATITTRTAGQRDVFISGTSSIRGHATIAPGDTLAQLRCTLENLREISRACGLDANVSVAERFVKIYLRHREDLAVVAPVIEYELLRAGDHVSYLQADICRAGLNIEIELTLLGVG